VAARGTQVPVAQPIIVSECPLFFKFRLIPSAAAQHAMIMSCLTSDLMVVYTSINRMLVGVTVSVVSPPWQRLRLVYSEARPPVHPYRFLNASPVMMRYAQALDTT